MKSWEEEAAEAEKAKRKKVLEAKQVVKELPPIKVRWFSFEVLAVVLGAISALIFMVLFFAFDEIGRLFVIYVVVGVFGIIYVLSPIIALSYLRTIRNEIVKIRREMYREK